MAEGKASAKLARRLRELREHEWTGVTLTQADLARALSAQSRVAPATLSSWESLTNFKTPTTARLNAYARFFSTRRSVEGTPHLLAVDNLTDDERERFEQLEEELFTLHAAIDEASAGDEDQRRVPLLFSGTEPFVIICPEAPKKVRGPLADEKNINHTRLHKFADIDALLEMFGHIRALNPERPVLARLPPEIQQTDLQNHIVLIGGIGWNRTTRRILSSLDKLPVEQIDHEEVPDGEVFRLKQGENHEVLKEAKDRGEKPWLPVMGVDDNGESELVEDVGLIARLPNPFNSSRTVTICNGTYSKGVLGAVLALTDETVRPANERYLAQNFPNGDFAMLVRVPVVSNQVLAPDLQNPHTRLFEWPSEPTTGA